MFGNCMFFLSFFNYGDLTAREKEESAKSILAAKGECENLKETYAHILQVGWDVFSYPSPMIIDDLTIFVFFEVSFTL